MNVFNQNLLSVAEINNVTRVRRLESRQPVSSVYIIPTTRQVMEMYNNQVINNSELSRGPEQCKPPPEYGHVVVEIPPTYEEATSRVVEQERRNVY